MIMNSIDTKVPSKPLHFRPIRYEVQAEVDKLFGLSQNGQRQLALRHRDEDGRIWFDGLEEEEFRHLLQPRSIPNSPTSPFDFDLSRRSSTATGLSNSVPNSPSNPFFASIGQSSENGLTRRRSSISTNFFIQSDDAKDLQRRKSVPFMPLTAMLEQGTNLNPDKCIHSIGQSAQADPIYKRRRNKRSRSNDDLDVKQYKNKVILERLTAGDESLPEKTENSSVEDTIRTTDVKIVMPSFLPIPRHQADEKTLEEVFGPLDKEKVEKVESSTVTSNPAVCHSPYSSCSSSPSPTESHYDNVELGIDAERNRKRTRENVKNERSNGNTQREKECRVNHPGLKSAFTQENGNRNASYTTAENPKAAAMLGMTANNEKLLVPGGLGTGEHVYDGIEIPCASVRLQSDDEEEEEEEEEENVKISSRGLRSRFDRHRVRMRKALQ